MAAETEFTYDTQAGTGSITLVVNGVTVTSHTYAAGNVVVGPLVLTTMTFPEWVGVVADALLWQAGLLRRFVVPLDSVGGWRSNLHSTPNKVAFTFKVGSDTLLDGEWTKSTNLVTLQPRGAVTVTAGEWVRWFVEIKRYQNEIEPHRQ